jgi:ATP-grasp domain
VEPELFNPSEPHFLRVTADTESEHFVLAGVKTLQHHVSVLPFRPYRRGCQTVADDIVRLNPDIVFNFIEHIGMGSIDKAASKHAVSSVGFPVPPFVVLPVGSTRGPRRMFDFPAIVKPQFGAASEGLTLGSVIHSERELIRRARKIHHTFEESAICERFIDGRELSAGLIEEKNDVLAVCLNAPNYRPNRYRFVGFYDLGLFRTYLTLMVAAVKPFAAQKP